MGVSLAEAESLKIASVSKQDVPEQIRSIINATNDIVTEDIRNSFDYYVNSQSGGTQITKCYFTGGSSVVPGLVQSIAAAVNVQLEPFNPYTRIKSKSDLYSNQFLEQVARFCPIAFGLGLRKVGDS
jgi:type IV pilus assembly protein PilM